MQKSFTLIELLVVIAIIALLSTLGANTYFNFQVNARDTRRKSDLRTITQALNSYYAANGRYPLAANSDVACAINSNCYVYSTHITAGVGKWITALTTGGYLENLPVDPINNAAPPWTTGNYTYSYGNVGLNGQTYDLTTQLESTSDSDRCAVKKYKFYAPTTGATIDWCGTYSTQIYEDSPLP